MKKKITKQFRVATVADLKPRAVIYTKDGYDFTIEEKYQDGIWNTTKCKVIFEGEIHHYLVEV